MFKNISMVAVILSISYACLYAGTGAVTPTNEELMQKAHRMQMPFIANEGQTDEQVAYYAKTFGGTVCVTKEGGIVYLLPKYEADAKGRHTNSNRAEGQDHVPSYSTGVMTSLLSQPQWTSQLHDKWWQKIAQGGPDNIFGVQPDNHKQELSGVTLKEEFVGGKTFDIRGEKRSETKVSYFRGNDPSKWKTNIATYEYATLGEVYKGIEIRLKAYGNNVEKLFCVKPGANPEQINIRLSGAETSLEKEVAGLSVNEQGELVTETALGPVKFTKPVAYQEINGKRVEVEVEYMVKDSASTRPGIKEQGLEYGFTVASYDRTKDLIVDPLLASTFLGGSNKERGNAIVLDSNGNVFVTGQTLSTNFPTTAGAYNETYNGGDSDIFISKFNDNLTSLLASTFLGGSDEDWGNCIALDSSDNVFVTGHTFSADLPTTIGAYDKTLSGFKDAFVSKLSNELGTLTASTYLGGNGSDWGTGIVIDKNDNSVFVSGYSNSANYPTTTGAYDQTYNGDQDVVVSKLSNNLGTLTASTYLGGNRASEQCNAIALDSNGNIFVTGWTGSSDFPTTTGAQDVSFNGSTHYGDVFVSKFPNDLGTLTASTFLGGSGDEIGNCIALDSNDNVFVSGYTKSANYPTTLEAYNETYMGGSDIFISKFNNNLTSLLASTLLGKSQDDECYGIALDKSDHVLVTGFTGSADFPTTSGAYDDTFNGYYDALVSKFSNDLKNLLESTFFGGIYFEEGKGFAVDSSGNVFAVGWGGSPNFPTTVGAYDETLNGPQDGNSSDVFVVKFNNFTIISPTPTPGTSTPTSTPDTPTPTPGTPTPTPVSTATPTPGTPTPTPVSTATPTPGTPTPTPVSTATPTPGTPTPTPVSTATPTPTPSPTPVPCNAKKLNVKPKSLKLWLGNDTEKTVILTCKDGFPSVNQPVKAKVVSGKKCVTVSPTEAYTDENGQATFTITATNKTGTAVVRFKHKNLIDDVTVKVKKAPG